MQTGKQRKQGQACDSAIFNHQCSELLGMKNSEE